ncbi:MAG: Asr1405/Asl0597 family protein [Cyanobacteria bacterium P01_C01_bin.147]
MEFDFSAPTEFDHPLIMELELDSVTRWDVYLRLKEHSIPCTCKHGQPLRVQIHTVGAALRLWSILQTLTASREVMVERLQRCWKKSLVQ